MLAFDQRRNEMLGIMMKSPHRGKLAIVFGLLAVAGIGLALS